VSFSIAWVLPRLAVGSAPSTTADVRRLVTLGVTDVLDLRLHPVDLGVDTSNASAIYAGTGIRYHSTPMHDNGTQKTVAQYVDAVSFVRDALAKANTKVFVHCAAGQYRSPAVVYAVLRAMGDSHETAWARITGVRQVYDQYEPGAEASVPYLPRVVLGTTVLRVAPAAGTQDSGPVAFVVLAGAAALVFWAVRKTANRSVP